MEIVQNYQISGEEEPYKKAIKECIEKGILADYLMRKGSEVVNMLLDEYDYETDIEVYGIFQGQGCRCDHTGI